MKRSFHISTTPRSILATYRSRKAYAFARTHAVAILQNDSVKSTAARGARISDHSTATEWHSLFWNLYAAVRRHTVRGPS
jgi:hypothetical protein